jgi:hypothetical protein
VGDDGEDERAREGTLARGCRRGDGTGACWSREGTADPRAGYSQLCGRTGQAGHARHRMRAFPRGRQFVASSVVDGLDRELDKRTAQEQLHDSLMRPLGTAS